MMRIAQVMGYMNGGGVEAVVMNYYRHIDRSKVQFDFLVCEGSEMVPYEEIESLGGRVFVVPSYSDVIGYQRRLISLFREQKWSIVHSHVNTLSVFPLRAAKRAGVAVRIAHSHSTAGRGEYVKNIMKYTLRLFANAYPTHRLACSRCAGEWLFGKHADFCVLPNAVDVASFAPDAATRSRTRAELGISSDQLLVGHIGRFAEQKNHSKLLEVFCAVLELRPDAVLVLAGEGPLLEQTRLLSTKLGISDSVFFLGPRDDVPSLYQAFDVFCLPSLYEGLPVVGVECQASGTPILASDQVTRETAMTSLMEFESLSSSPETWASHLLAMCGKTLSSEDAEKLFSFDISACACDLEGLYERCLKEVK